MFLSTKSEGIRRLSLVLGLLAAAWGVVPIRGLTLFGSSAFDEDQRVFVFWVNVGEIVVLAGVCFVVVWSAVRIGAWVIDGFRE